MYLILYRKKVAVGDLQPPFELRALEDLAAVVRAVRDLELNKPVRSEYLIAETLDIGMKLPQIPSYGGT